MGVTLAVPELLAASTKPPRPFLQQALLRRLGARAQSGSQTDTQTGAHGGTAPSRQRGWRRRYRSAGGGRGAPRTSHRPLGPACTAVPDTPALFVSQP